MHQSNQFQLLGQRRFAPFFWTQFLGAANDNIFKFAFTVLATYAAAEWGGLDPAAAGAVIGGIFVLPFVLFSATAGQFADKFEKSALMRFVKNFEIAVMLVIGAGFVWKVPALLFAGTFLMGLHSTIFGPVKFSYLPQHLRTEELTGGNGMVEMGTFVAILLGTMAGGALIGLPGSGPIYVASLSIGLALLGRVAVAFVPVSPASDPALAINWNPLTETWKNLVFARSNRAVFLSMLGISWLWFFGAVFLTSFAGFSKEVLGGDQQVVTLLLGIFSIGIGTGSLLCERLSGHKVEIGLVPFGSIGMTCFAVDLWFTTRGLHPSGLVGVSGFLATPVHWRVAVDLFLLALFAGLYSVPLYAMIQSRCEPSHRARVIAANNILNALFMVASSAMFATLTHVGFPLPQIYLVTALLNALVAIYIYTLVPEFLMRFLAWMLIHSFYRVRKSGLENIPDEGPCVIACNHVSYVDAVVITACCQRPIRFIMDHRIFKVPLLSFLFRTMRAIPIAPEKEDPHAKERAFADAAAALRAGEIIGIFPEGRLTDSGELNPFRSGVNRIVAETPVPVIPMALQGLWGSFFSRYVEGKAMRRIRGVFSRIGLVVGTPLAPADVRPESLQQTVLALRGERR